MLYRVRACGRDKSEVQQKISAPQVGLTRSNEDSTRTIILSIHRKSTRHAKDKSLYRIAAVTLAPFKRTHQTSPQSPRETEDH
ncbi:hypothetical protein WG66_002196 [Moniliophthora roreri]|nr:hypothetical protein WG66_002196 [Moniliophthora roreri]